MQLESSHVALPSEDFRELTRAAYENTEITPTDRIASTAQTFMVLGAMAGAVVGGSFGIAKAADWLEHRRWKRAHRIGEYKDDSKQS